MNLLERFKVLKENLLALDLQTIKYYKIISFFALIVSMVGIYWYFGFKKLGTALILVSIGFIALFLFLEREKSPPESKTTTKSKKSTDDTFSGFEMPSLEGSGLPSLEEYNKRVEKAFSA